MTNIGCVEHGASSTLIGAPCLEITFCSSTVSSVRFKIFLIENEFSLAENEEMPGVEDAIPLVAIIMVLAHGVMLPIWACNMAPALEKEALEFMIIYLVSHYHNAIVRTLSMTISATPIQRWFYVFPLKEEYSLSTGLNASKREASRILETILTYGVFLVFFFFFFFYDSMKEG